MESRQHGRTWPWRALRVALCLAAAVLANVLVAWGCVLWAPHPWWIPVQPVTGWPIRAPHDWPSSPNRLSSGTSVGLTRSIWIGAERPWESHPPPRLWLVTHLEAGLPWRSMVVRSIVSPGRSESGGVSIPDWVPDGRLPVRPLWLGFAANTALYFVVISLLWHVAISLRARLRRRAAGCPRCGYDLTGLPAPAICPECGSARKTA